MEHEEIEVAEKLEGIGDAIEEQKKPLFSFSYEAPAALASEALAKADEFVAETAVTESVTKAGLVDALSLTINALQEVFAELEEAKLETLAVAKRATEKATRAGIELDLSLLDDPFDAALQDVNRLLNTLEKQRNRARMAQGNS